MSETPTPEARIADPADLEWAVERVTKMCAIAYVNASRFGLKLIKGFGYPDEAFSDAQDARALATVLDQLASKDRDLAALRQENANLKLQLTELLNVINNHKDNLE